MFTVTWQWKNDNPSPFRLFCIATLLVFLIDALVDCGTFVVLLLVIGLGFAGVERLLLIDCCCFFFSLADFLPAGSVFLPLVFLPLADDVVFVPFPTF